MNTTGLSDKAYSAEAFYFNRLNSETYEGSILRQGLNLDKVDEVLQAKAARYGERGVYGVHVILDEANMPGSAIDQQADLLEDFIGLYFREGGWKPGERGGYQGLVGWYTLVYISRLGTLREVCHLING